MDNSDADAENSSFSRPDSWIGRCNFSRAVCHRLDACRVDALPAFRHGIADSSKEPSRLSVKSGRHSTGQDASLLFDYSGRSTNCTGRSISSGSLFGSSFHSSPMSSSSVATLSPLNADFLELENKHGEPKRTKSWSQFLESPSQDVKAVKLAEEWNVDMKELFFGQRFASGANSRLYHGVYKGQAVAIKVIRQPDEDEEIANRVERHFIHEVSLLSKLQHRNIVKFVAACSKVPVFCIITEYMPGGSLRAFLHKNDPRNLPLTRLMKMALDLAEGMEYVHSHGIIHADLKSENLVLDDDHSIKITDFGTARLESETEERVQDVGTYRWMAPEMISHKPSSKKVDVFSFGIILWELVTGMVPFHQLSAVQSAYAIVHKNARPEVPTYCPLELKQLMKRCWNRNPDKRPEFSHIRKILEEYIGLLNGKGYESSGWPAVDPKNYVRKHSITPFPKWRTICTSLRDL